MEADVALPTSPIFNPLTAGCWSTLISQYEYWIRAELAVEMFLREALLEVIHNDRGDFSYKGLTRDKLKLHAILFEFKVTKQCKLKGKVSKKQWDTMCPISGMTNSEAFDVTTEIVIIREKLELRPSVEWNDKYVSNPENIADYCILARELRNKVKHQTLRNIITDSQFQNIWEEFRKILVGLNFSQMTLFHQLKTGPIDSRISQIVIILQKKIDSMVHTIGKLQSIVEVSSLIDVDNIKQAHDNMLKDALIEKGNLTAILEMYTAQLTESLHEISGI